MALRQEYALGHSRLNGFLFAVIGEEENGQELTVLSALSRLGLNPWKEAAQLGDMPKQDATTALADTLARLPEDDGWLQADRLSISARLVDLLPKYGVRGDYEVSPGDPDLVRAARTEKLRKAVFWAVFAAAITVAIVSQISG